MAVSVGDLTALVTFARIVEHGSMTAGARALGVSKSTASARLSSLEQRLRVRTVDRFDALADGQQQDLLDFLRSR